MDKLKFGLFDIFVYTLPGALLLFTMYLATIDFTKGITFTIMNIIQFSNTITFNYILFIIFTSYILGFSLHFFGYNFFNTVGKRVWKKRLRGKEKSLSTNEKHFVLVRHYSKENFAFVEQWYTFRAMSFNLSLVFLIGAVIILTKIVSNWFFKLEWIMLDFSFLLLSFVLMRRAITFHMWSHNTLEETVNALDLLNKKDEKK